MVPNTLPSFDFESLRWTSTGWIPWKLVRIFKDNTHQSKIAKLLVESKVNWILSIQGVNLKIPSVQDQAIGCGFHHSKGPKHCSLLEDSSREQHWVGGGCWGHQGQVLPAGIWLQYQAGAPEWMNLVAKEPSTSEQLQWLYMRSSGDAKNVVYKYLQVGCQSTYVGRNL